MPFGRGKKTVKLGSNAPDGPGQVNLPNPGEYPPDGDAVGLRRNTVGAFPASGHRAGGGTTIGPAEQVAIRRQLEFSAGGRSQLVQGGPVSPAAPHVSAKTGQVLISTATEGVSEEVGNVRHPTQPPVPDPQGGPSDAATPGEVGPERRPDRKGL